MVTFLEANLFGYFNSLFIFLFVLVASYAILTSIKVFGNNAFINAIIAFILAAVFASSDYASRTFQYATPWLVLLFVLFMFIMIIFKFLGAEGKDIPISPVGNPAMQVIISVFILVIFVLAAGQANKERKEKQIVDGEIDEGGNRILSFPEKIGETLRHPAVLGLIMVLLMATFTILILASAPGK
jgi:hypothetical protein